MEGPSDKGINYITALVLFSFLTPVMIGPFHFVSILKINHSSSDYLPYPECLENEKGCDPCDNDCKNMRIISIHVVCGLVYLLCLFPIYILYGLNRSYKSDKSKILTAAQKPHEKWLRENNQWENSRISDELSELSKILLTSHRSSQIVLILVLVMGPWIILPVLIQESKLKKRQKKFQKTFEQNRIGIWRSYQNMNIIGKGIKNCEGMIVSWNEKELKIIDGLGPAMTEGTLTYPFTETSYKRDQIGPGIIPDYESQNSTNSEIYHENLKKIWEDEDLKLIDKLKRNLYEFAKKQVADDLKPRTLYEVPIEDLKQIVEVKGYSAITVYPDFNQAILRNFHYQLSVDDCEPAEGYNCVTHILQTCYV